MCFPFFDVFTEEDLKMFVLVALFVAVLGYVLTPLVAVFSYRIGAVDVPQDWRRMHRESIPRGGGLAIFLPFFIGWVLLGDFSPFFVSAMSGAALMLAVGLVDDVFCLGAFTKLFFQIAAALATVLGGGVGENWGEVGLAVLWILLLTNAHNFIDGMDGLFAGCAGIEGMLLGFSALLIGRYDVTKIAVLLSIACFAFRPYNRYPARIFAGDCGSESVGFLLGVLSLSLFQAPALSIENLSPLFLFAYPLADLTAAVVRRLLRGKSPFSADRAHFHHRIYAAGLAVPECVWSLLCINLSLGAVGVFLRVEELWGLAAVASVLGIPVLWGIRRYVLKSSGALERF